MKVLFIFLIFLPILSSGTCIVIYKAGNELYVAADSKMTFQHTSKPPQTICKIYNAGKYYFAISGYGARSLYENAMFSLKRHSDIDAAIQSFGTAMQKRYKRFWRRTKTKDPGMYDEVMYSNFASVAFFYIENGQPIIKNIRFRLTDAGETAVTYKVNNVDHALLGYDDHIRRLSSEDRAGLIDKYPGHFENYCRDLVELELKYHPADIGSPIDLMKLDSAGTATWFTERRECKF